MKLRPSSKHDTTGIDFLIGVVVLVLDSLVGLIFIFTQEPFTAFVAAGLVGLAAGGSCGRGFASD